MDSLDLEILALIQNDVRVAHASEFPGVARTITSISLCTIKESGGPPLPVRLNEAIAPKWWSSITYDQPGGRPNA